MLHFQAFYPMSTREVKKMLLSKKAFGNIMLRTGLLFLINKNTMLCTGFRSKTGNADKIDEAVQHIKLHSSPCLCSINRVFPHMMYLSRYTSITWNNRKGKMSPYQVRSPHLVASMPLYSFKSWVGLLQADSRIPTSKAF